MTLLSKIESSHHLGLLRASAALGFLAVLLGAFGAHGLQDLLLERKTTAIWQTAVQYHFYHTLALLVIALVPSATERWRTAIGGCWIAGTLFFSGSLYLLAFTGERWLGAITPIGGVFFLLGWGLLLFSASKKKR